MKPGESKQTTVSEPWPYAPPNMSRKENPRSKNADLVLGNIISTLKARPELAQSYEAIVAQIRLHGATEPLKSVMVTSAIPNEGKTTVAINLALTLALAGERIALLDGNVSGNGLYESMFEIPLGAGSSESLSKGKSASVASLSVDLASLDSNTNGALDVFHGGQAYFGSLASSSTTPLRKTLDNLGTAYDLLIVDAPAILAGSSAQLLATAVDGVLFVVHIGVLQVRQAIRARDQVRQTGTPIIGVIVNRIDETR